MNNFDDAGKAGVNEAVTLSQPGVAQDPTRPDRPPLVLPRVEIFAQQQGILLHQGDIGTIELLGAVYDIDFVGTIAIEPSEPGSCLIFDPTKPHAQYVQARVGNNTIRLQLFVRAPNNAAPCPNGSLCYNCTLRYTALFEGYPTLGVFSVGKGIPIRIPFSIRRKRRVGEQDDMETRAVKPGQVRPVDIGNSS